MRAALVAIAASLVFGGTAVAADRAHRPAPLVIPNNPRDIPDGPIRFQLHPAERAHGHVAHCTNVADLKAQLKARINSKP